MEKSVIINGMKDKNCNCKQPDCDNGHFPVQVSEDGDVDWVGCPKCVINGKHLCDQEFKKEQQILI